MSLSLPEQDTPTSAPQPSLDSARQAQPKLPWRARVSLYRQRTILFFRYILRPFYHIPIDDIKEQFIQESIGRLAENQKMLLENLNTLINVSNQMQSRLAYYEKRDPGLRDLRKNWEREQERLQGVMKEARDSGILSMTPTNGRNRIIRP